VKTVAKADREETEGATEANAVPVAVAVAIVKAETVKAATVGANALRARPAPMHRRLKLRKRNRCKPHRKTLLLRNKPRGCPPCFASLLLSARKKRRRVKCLLSSV
jgi:hypothetical protein